MNFLKAMPPLLQGLGDAGVDCALIGGVAVYLSGVDRTTKDIDFMAFLADSDKVDGTMKKLGYRLLHRSDDAANYWSDDPDAGRVDFLFAHRSYSNAMLKRAETTRYFGRDVKILRHEDIIGLKVQALSNNPDRERKDRYDIEDLMARHGKGMDWVLIREYFDLFGRGTQCEELRRKYQ